MIKISYFEKSYCDNDEKYYDKNIFYETCVAQISEKVLKQYFNLEFPKETNEIQLEKIGNKIYLRPMSEDDVFKSIEINENTYLHLKWAIDDKYIASKIDLITGEVTI